MLHTRAFEWTHSSSFTLRNQTFLYFGQFWNIFARKYPATGFVNGPSDELTNCKFAVSQRCHICEWECSLVSGNGLRTVSWTSHGRSLVGVHKTKDTEETMKAIRASVQLTPMTGFTVYLRTAHLPAEMLNSGHE